MPPEPHYESIEHLTVLNWSALQVCDQVNIIDASGARFPGIVDDVCNTGAVFWIRGVGLSERRLVHKADKVEVSCARADLPEARIAALLKSTPLEQTHN